MRPGAGLLITLGPSAPLNLRTKGRDQYGSSCFSLRVSLLLFVCRRYGCRNSTFVTRKWLHPSIYFLSLIVLHSGLQGDAVCGFITGPQGEPAAIWTHTCRRFTVGKPAGNPSGDGESISTTHRKVPSSGIKPTTLLL